MTVHSRTKLKPTETFAKLEYEQEINLRKPKFRVGDIVRIHRWKSHFEKGYTKRWTNELFIIFDVLNIVPWTYTLYDLYGEEILGSFFMIQSPPSTATRIRAAGAAGLLPD